MSSQVQILNMTDFVTIKDNDGNYHRFHVIDDDTNNTMLHQIDNEGKIQSFSIYNKNCQMDQDMLDEMYFGDGTPIKSFEEYRAFVSVL